MTTIAQRPFSQLKQCEIEIMLFFEIIMPVNATYTEWVCTEAVETKNVRGLPDSGSSGWVVCVFVCGVEGV